MGHEQTNFGRIEEKDDASDDNGNDRIRRMSPSLHTNPSFQRSIRYTMRKNIRTLNLDHSLLEAMSPAAPELKYETPKSAITGM